MLWKHKVKKVSGELRSYWETGTHDWNWECCSYNDRLITMDPPEQLRLPMFIVGSMRASEFNVFVVNAGGQLPVSDALFFVAGPGLAPCSMLLTLSARASGGHRFVRLDPPSSCFISIFACQGDHDSSAESCMRMQNWKPYLQPFVRY